MARMSEEQKLVDRMKAVMMREDVSPQDIALFIHRCGYLFHQKIFAFMLQMIRHWTIDYDNQVTHGSDEYLLLTMRARQLQDVIDRWK